jgi:hypothetical protein
MFTAVLGTLLSFTVTCAASGVGPRLSGFFAMFSVIGTILVGFSHAASGRAYAVNILLGMAPGCVTHSRPFAWCCDRADVRDGGRGGAGGAGSEQVWGWR